MLQIQHVANLVARLQHRIDITLDMTRAEAEPNPTSDERGSRVRNDDNDNGRLALEHQSRERAHLAGVEEEERDDGRVGMSVGDEAEFLETAREVPGVERQTLETLAAFEARAHLWSEGHPGGDEGRGCGPGVRLELHLVFRDVAAGEGGGRG